jgi:U4/U6 small nuclear ribonucleoprotein PRP31
VQFIRDHYAPRFIELESLGIATPLDYCRAVKAIGNPEEFDKSVAESVKGILPNATAMIVAVTASENSGRQLTAREWAAVEQACDMMLSLDTDKRRVSRSC